jgi:hypothetical protein
MDTVHELLTLPVNVLGALAAGYLSYRLAYTGRDEDHETVDRVMICLVFAFIAQSLTLGLGAVVALFWRLTDPVGHLLVLVGMTAAIGIAAFWRKRGQEMVRKRLSALKISHSDRHKTAWETIVAREGTKPVRMLVTQTNGVQRICQRLGDFANERFSACIWGPDGSVAMYVTHTRVSPDAEWEEMPVRDEDNCVDLTYLPADQIERINILFSPPD